ncbi:MAG TPA: MBOAT family O-acyltransferase [Planctomycetota bacterium]|nr:MBOAT family O-acyltransferase [Planctomycetota bacterium]
MDAVSSLTTAIDAATSAVARAVAPADPSTFRFLAVAVGTAALVSAIPGLGRSRARLLVTLPALVLALGARTPGFFAVSVGTFALARAATAVVDPDRRWTCHCVLILGLAVLFLAGREGGCFRPVSWRGLEFSYFDLDMLHLVRLITFVWEQGAGRLRATLATYIFWETVPVTLQGPVLRYSELTHEPRACPSRARAVAVARAVVQISLGVALAKLVHHVFVAGDIHVGWPTRALIGFNAPAWGFYLLSAGYATLMQECGSPWGLGIPDNFDRPFFRTNLSDFWAHWNATVTSVFRDVIFFNRWGVLRKPNAYLNVMFVFLACGAWHGANAYWLLWGALHGLGFVTFLLWRRYAPPRARDALQSPAGRVLSGLLTYMFVCSCWVLPNKVVAAWRTK